MRRKKKDPWLVALFLIKEALNIVFLIVLALLTLKMLESYLFTLAGFSLLSFILWTIHLQRRSVEVDVYQPRSGGGMFGLFGGKK